MAVSRRKALKGGVAAMGAAVAIAAAVTPVLAVEGDDGELIALCGQVVALEDHTDALCVRFADLDGHEEDENGETFDDLNIANYEQRQAIVARICSLPCRTSDGQRAIAECFARLQHRSGEFQDGPCQRHEIRLLLALVRAVLGRATEFDTARRPPGRAAPEALAALAARASEEAELIECVERYISTWDAGWDLTAHQVDAPPELEAEADRLYGIADGFAERVVLLPAATRAGEVAKMRLLARWTDQDLSDGKWRDPERGRANRDRLIMSLLHDMTGEA